MRLCGNVPRAFVAALLLLPTLGFCAAKTSHLDFRREAQSAYQRKDYPAALAAVTAALQLRPDSPRYHYIRASLLALTGDERSALAELGTVADFGVILPLQGDPDFARLQGQPGFLRLLQRFAENAQPRGEAEVVAELPGRTGIIEGIAFRERTGDLFLGDVHDRCVWRRDRDGRVTRFTVDDEELFGVFGLAVDEARNTLWAATAALPEMRDYDREVKGFAALAEFDLTTAELRRVVAVPVDGRDHALGDLVLGPDGTVYASDSKAPAIWQLSPGAEELEKTVESPVFNSLQGMALFQRTLVVADYSNGLMTVDLATRNIAALLPPEKTTLLGLDGVVAVPGGIVATQNGVEPQRVLRITFSREVDRVTDVAILASSLPQLNDLTLMTLVNGRPTWIAGAGWDGFDPAKAKQPAGHTVRIFQASLP